MPDNQSRGSHCTKYHIRLCVKQQWKHIQEIFYHYEALVTVIVFIKIEHQKMLYFEYAPLKLLLKMPGPISQNGNVIQMMHHHLKYLGFKFI